MYYILSLTVKQYNEVNILFNKVKTFTFFLQTLISFTVYIYDMLHIFQKKKAESTCSTFHSIYILFINIQTRKDS